MRTELKFRIVVCLVALAFLIVLMGRASCRNFALVTDDKNELSQQMRQLKLEVSDLRQQVELLKREKRNRDPARILE